MSARTPANFVEWLRGFLDAVGDSALTDAQRKKIQDELAKVGASPMVTPSTGGSDLLKKLLEQQPSPYIIPTYPTQPYIEPSFPPWFTGPTITYGGGTAAVGGAVLDSFPHACSLLSPLQVDFNPNAACCAAPPTFKAFNVELNYNPNANNPSSLFATAQPLDPHGPTWVVPTKQGVPE